MERRRRTDQLAAVALPAAPLARAAAAAEALVAAGFEAAFVLQLPKKKGSASLRAAHGRVEPYIPTGTDAALQALYRRRAFDSIRVEDPRSGLVRTVAAIPCGSVRGRNLALIVVDRNTSRRESEAIAVWAAVASPVTDTEDPSTALVRELLVEHNADTVVLALFAQSGMLLNLHTRSGDLLRAWRLPMDTVWGEAARHGAAYVLGDLPMHPGAECLASLGMNAAAVVGIENGSGVALGSVGVGAYDSLDIDVAHTLLAQAPLLGPRIMSLRSRTSVPVPDERGEVQLDGFAARVGCDRFAMYSRNGTVLQLVSAHDRNGNPMIAAPDVMEEQLVCWAAEKGAAVTSEDAAAVIVGDDTVLYARDPNKRPIDCLRLALQDLRHNPEGDQRRAA
jgi:hypothetical protein